MAFPTDNFSDVSINEEINRSEDLGEASIEREKKAMNEENLAKKEEIIEEDIEACLIVLPPEIIRHIVSFLDFDALNKMRLVSRDFNDLCRSLLIIKLLKLQEKVHAYVDLSFQRAFHFKAYVAMMFINVYLAKVMAVLAVPAEDQKNRFDAGKVIEDAARLLDRVKSEEKVPCSSEETIPHSFILFKTFCEKRSASTAISDNFYSLE